MKAYKYVDLGEVESAVAAGCARIGTLRSFGKLESERCDPLEGVSVTVQDRPIVTEKEPTRIEKMQAEALGIKFTRGRGLTIVDSRRATWLPDMYAYCASIRQDNTTLATERDQAVFEIADLRLFAEKVRQLEPDKLGAPIFRPVKYASVVGFAINGHRRPSPFLKEVRFANDQEVRIVWPPSSPGRRVEGFDVPANLEIATLFRLVGYIRGGVWQPVSE